MCAAAASQVAEHFAQVLKEPRLVMRYDPVNVPMDEIADAIVREFADKGVLCKLYMEIEPLDATEATYMIVYDSDNGTCVWCLGRAIYNNKVLLTAKVGRDGPDWSWLPDYVELITAV